jgi:hypothetical protein
MANLYYGVNTAFNLVSKSHGRKELEFNEQFDIDVGLANKRLWFFNKKEALALSVFEGVSGRFGYLETESKDVSSVLQDVASSSTVVNDDPSSYQEFQIYLNYKNEAGVIEQGTFVKGCRVTSAPEAISPKEEQHNQVSYIGAIRYKIKGAGIQYTRFVSSAPAVTTADDVAVSGSDDISGTLPYSATSINVTTPTTTRTYLAVYRNGTDVTTNATYTGSATAFSVSGTAVVFPSGTFGTTDVWELYTAYVPA